MAERLPPDDGDDLFEWTDAPASSSRPDPPERATGDTGERAAAEPERGDAAAARTPDTGERDPFATGERPPVADRPPRRGRPSDTEERRVHRGDTGEFERSGRKPPPGRRYRHRDLPAKVRRRQAIGIGVVALVVIIGLIVLISGGGSEEKPISVKRLVGQSIVVRMPKGAPTPDLLKRVRKGQVGGVIALAADPQQLQANVKTLQDAASAGGNSPLLVMVDQEGGPVKRLKNGPPDSSPTQLGSSGDTDEAKSQGEQTGSFLKGLGINVDLAPVLDVPQPNTADTIASRTFGNDVSTVSSVGVAFAEGLQDGGVAATAKHFPGLGRATANTDDHPVAIAATREELEAEIQPFRDAVDAGVAMVMVSSASYPPLNVKGPAVFSSAVVQGMLRGDLGFDGVVITDDLDSSAITSTTNPAEAAAGAITAGNDLLLYAGGGNESRQGFAALVRLVKQGKLNRSVLESAYSRIGSLKSDLQ